jgi:hypothetical protein
MDSKHLPQPPRPLPGASRSPRRREGRRPFSSDCPKGSCPGRAHTFSAGVPQVSVGSSGSYRQLLNSSCTPWIHRRSAALERHFHPPSTGFSHPRRSMGARDLTKSFVHRRLQVQSASAARLTRAFEFPERRANVELAADPRTGGEPLVQESEIRWPIAWILVGPGRTGRPPTIGPRST